MSASRKFAAAATLATVVTLGWASAASAQVMDPAPVGAKPAPKTEHAKVDPGHAPSKAGKAGMRWYSVDDNGSLANLSDNNVGPFQVCDNDTPINGVGGQVPVNDVIGILGISSDGNTATLVKTCNQGSEQANDAKRHKATTHWYRKNDDGGLVNVSGNNAGPFQACHNNIPINGVGGQVPISDVTGVLGISSDGNTAGLVKTCDQQSQQHN